MITYEFKGLRPIAVRLDHGDELIAALQTFLERSGVGFAYLPGMVGQFDKVTLGFYDPKSATYAYRNLQRPQSEDEDPYSRFEPTTISGNVSWVVDGGPFAHVHGAFASGFPNHGGRVLGGGHISAATVGRTCEGVLFVTDDITVGRIMNPEPNCKVRVWNFVPHRRSRFA